MVYVRIVLAPRVLMPKWLKELFAFAGRVEISRFPAYGKGKTFRAVEIDGGLADFFPGGGVDIQMPGSKTFETAFGPMQVILISYPGSGIVKYNHYFCKKCFALTGRKIGTVPGGSHGQVHSNMECEKCGHKWKTGNI